MAKGDDSRVRDQINANNATMGGYYNPTIQSMQGSYGSGTSHAFGDYDTIMQGYKDLFNSPAGSLGGGGYGVPADQFKSYAGYENFAKTGGFSPEDIANMRARSSSQVRANYANAEREMNRQRTLQGGYSPNFMAASAKMAREQSQENADTVQNTNAGLAQMIQQGKLAGLKGMTPIEQARMQMAMQAAASGAASSQNDINNRFRALSGMTGLYGTTPALAQTFGNQLLGGMNSYGDYMNNSVGNQIRGAQMPGKWSSIFGGIKDIAGLGSNILPFLGGGGGGGGSIPGSTGGGPANIPGGISDPYNIYGGNQFDSEGNNYFGYPSQEYNPWGDEGYWGGDNSYWQDPATGMWGSYDEPWWWS